MRTYTVATPDVGKPVKVRVRFTDDASNPESVKSEAFPPGTTSYPETELLPDAHCAEPDITLAGVKVVTLPSAGSLVLDGTAVTANQSVSKADLDAGKLVFTPTENEYGDGYASFTFRVCDGTHESPSAYTMTIDVTPVNDPPTGKPTITGTAKVGETLTVDISGIADVDGIVSGTTWHYVWYRIRNVLIAAELKITNRLTLEP